MDNNNNNNVSGIPNVSDIKFDDTPAESFENLYGGGAGATQQPVGNMNINQGPSMIPNSSMGEPMMTPNPNIGSAPMTNPAPSVQAPVGPAAMPNPAPVQNASQTMDDLSNLDIDAEKMQSIEEQLSKTSQYNPADFQQEQITIPTDNQYEKNKSSLMFLVVIFVILGVTIALAPQIIKFIK